MVIRKVKKASSTDMCLYGIMLIHPILILSLIIFLGIGQFITGDFTDISELTNLFFVFVILSNSAMYFIYPSIKPSIIYSSGISTATYKIPWNKIDSYIIVKSHRKGIVVHEINLRIKKRLTGSPMIKVPKEQLNTVSKILNQKISR